MFEEETANSDIVKLKSIVSDQAPDWISCQFQINKEKSKKWGWGRSKYREIEKVPFEFLTKKCNFSLIFFKGCNFSLIMRMIVLYIPERGAMNYLSGF